MKDKIKAWLEKNDYLDGSFSPNQLPDLINDCLQDMAAEKCEVLEYRDWQEAKDLLVEAGFTVIPPK